MGQGQQSCQKWNKSKKLFKSYRVNKNLRPAAVAAAAPSAAYEPVQKHKVTPGIPGWLNEDYDDYHYGDYGDDDDDGDGDDDDDDDDDDGDDDDDAFPAVALAVAHGDEDYDDHTDNADEDNESDCNNDDISAI